MASPDDTPPEGTDPQQEALLDEFGPVSKEVSAQEAPADLPSPHPAEVRVGELEKDFKDLREWATRVAADFDNYKKRVERERQDQFRFATERLLKEFLPILDNLQRALDAASRSGEAPTIAAGVELVLTEMMKVLKRAGVEPIPSRGQVFDPSVHEALQRVETDAVDPGFVVAELQPGYTLQGRVLRPALVTVAAPPEVTSPGMERPDLE